MWTPTLLLLLSPVLGTSGFHNSAVKIGLFAITTAILAPICHAVTLGFEQYGNLNGSFYVFSSAGTVNIVNPVIGTVTKTLTVDAAGVTWGDPTYLRDQAQIKHYVFAADSGNDRMVVFDADSQTEISKVKIGDKPLHVYAIPSRDEVWAHLDNEGRFDVFHMSSVHYRASSGIAARSAVVTGHGKLLAEPSLEDTAFATNVNEGFVYQLSLSSRLKTNDVNLFASATAQNLPAAACPGTHGISFSSVNNRIYVECTGPATCVEPYISAVNCTSGIWGVDAKTLNVIARLVSPKLSVQYGAGFPIQGAPYRSPEESFILCSNKRLGVLAILKPTSTATQILEIPMSFSPGTIKFWPKDSSITFGLDPNPGNYWAIFALDDTTATSGLAFLDMALVVEAFDNGDTELPGTVVEYLVLGPGASSRPLERGSDYAVTPIYTSGLATSLAIVNLKTRKLSSTVALDKTAKLLWVPSHTDELAYVVKTQAAQISSLMATSTSTSTGSSDGGSDEETKTKARDGLGLAAVAFVLSLFALVGVVFILCFSNKKGGARGDNGFAKV